MPQVSTIMLENITYLVFDYFRDLTLANKNMWLKMKIIVIYFYRSIGIQKRLSDVSLRKDLVTLPRFFQKLPNKLWENQPIFEEQCPRTFVLTCTIETIREVYCNGTPLLFWDLALIVHTVCMLVKNTENCIERLLKNYFQMSL